MQVDSSDLIGANSSWSHLLFDAGRGGRRGSLFVVGRHVGRWYRVRRESAGQVKRKREGEKGAESSSGSGPEVWNQTISSQSQGPVSKINELQEEANLSA